MPAARDVDFSQCLCAPARAAAVSATLASCRDIRPWMDEPGMEDCPSPGLCFAWKDGRFERNARPRLARGSWKTWRLSPARNGGRI